MAAIIAVIICLFFASFPVEAVQPSRAEDNWEYGIWIYSPLNTTYAQNTLLLNVTAKRYISPTYYNAKLQYCINGGDNSSFFTRYGFIQKPTLGIFGDIASYTLFSGTAILPDLAQGKYNLTVYADYTPKEGADKKWPIMHDVQTIDFTINSGICPAITLLLGEKVTTENNNLTLDFVVDTSVSWIRYSLDGKNNETVTGNFTLSELTYGLHNVTIYAQDLLGNEGASATTNFTVEKKAQIGNELVMLLTIVTVIGVLGLIVLSRRHRVKIIQR
jgi:hypothetical protein